MRAAVVRSIALSVCLAVAWLGSLAEGQTQDLVRRGQELYGIYCAACHGESADGRGPAAEKLDTPPTDLRRIVTDKDGNFPADRVYRAIDGRDEVASHVSAMPVWGFAFQQLDRDVDQEDEVRGKILQIIAYLKSIQLD